MKVQVIQDDKGRITGVYIPINHWKELKKRYKGLQEMEASETTEIRLLNELNDAILELKQIEQKKKKARPVSELLNELPLQTMLANNP